MGEHNVIVNAEAHEPKHITDKTTADNGKIITSHGSVAGTSQYRAITTDDVTLQTDIYTVTMDDIADGTLSTWVVSKYAGTIEKIYCVVDGTVDVDTAITTEIATIAVTNGSFTITASGSAAGDVDSATPTGANTLTAGQAIEIITDGATTSTRNATFTIEVKRST